MAKENEKKESKYKDIKIPIALAKEIDEIVISGYRGCRNRSDLSVYAIRHLLDEISRVKNKNNRKG